MVIFEYCDRFNEEFKMNEDLILIDNDIEEPEIDTIYTISNILANLKEASLDLLFLLLFSMSSTQLSFASDYANETILVISDRDMICALQGSHILKMKERVDNLSKLESGWDKGDSLSIKNDVIDVFKQALFKFNDEDLVNWILFPDARGYLYLDYTEGKKIAGITIMPDCLVYFYKKSAGLNKGKVETSSEELINLVRKINEEA